jgi:UDP-GlcNAc:undecaprenyl-phosphate GlcNAc-1-phosphate transferase
VRLIVGWQDSLPLIAIAFFVAAFATVVLTPYVRRIAARYEIVDRPGGRRVNEAPVPRGGGLAIAGTFVVVAIIVMAINAAFNLVPMPDTIGLPEMGALLVGGVAAATMGAVDDYLQLRARWQGLGQLLLALATVLIGVGVDFIANPFAAGVVRFDEGVLGAFIGGAFSVFWYLGMINSINWIDGLDGLSSGVGLIASVTLGVISLTTAVGQPFVAVLCFALAGSLLGFLRWNFHPASIFMGTSGTMFVGYALAVLSILGTAKVAVAMLVLGVPIIDTFWIIVRRLAAHRSPFEPDRGHIHHRLLDLGLSHTQTVLLIYGLCIALAILSLILSGAAQLYAFVAVVIVAGLVFYALSRRSDVWPPTPEERRQGAHPVTPEARGVAGPETDDSVARSAPTPPPGPIGATIPTATAPIRAITADRTLGGERALGAERTFLAEARHGLPEPPAPTPPRAR